MKAFSQFGIKLMGFNCGEAEQFAAILSLAEGHVQHEWRLVSEEGDAHFFVFPEQALQAALLPNMPLAYCLFYGNGEEDNRIATDAGRIPLLSSLEAALNKAGARFFPLPPAPDWHGLATRQAANLPAVRDAAAPGESIGMAAKPITPDKDGATAFVPQGLLKLLLDGGTAPLLIRLGAVGLCADYANGVYYSQSSLEQFAPCFATDDAQPATKPITPAELAQIIGKAQLKPQPLNSLVWYAALQGSQGRLLSGVSPEDIVHLSRWPDLGIPGCGHYVGLAAFMHSNTVKLADIAAACHYPVASVYNFYNACHLVGLTKQGGAVHWHQKPASPENKLLLKKIRDRISL